MTVQIPTLLQKALGLHQAGRLAEAERLYDAVLKRDRANADALNLKAAILQAQGKHGAATDLFDRAIAAHPAFPEAHYNRALSLTALSRVDDALLAYGRAIAARPAYAEAHLNLALLLRDLGRRDEALGAFRRMIHVCPNDARGHHGLASLLTEGSPNDTGKEEAQAAFRKAVLLAPRDPDAHFGLANLLAAAGETAAAIATVRDALKFKPDWPEALSNLGEWLKTTNQFDEAVTVQRRAAALRPGDSGLQFNLADALAKANEVEEAERLLNVVIEREPNFVRAHVNLGIIHKDRGASERALQCFERALDLDATLHQAYSNIGAIFAEKGWLTTSLILHDKGIFLRRGDGAVRMNRAVCALQLGRFTEGWPDYEYRFEAPKEYLERRPTPPAYWNGKDLRGKRILIWTEQGIGDEILHASMFAEIAARADRTIIECSRRLAPVFARSFPSTEVIGREDNRIAMAPRMEADFQIAAGSLGRHLRPGFEAFAKQPGYLKADPVKAAELRAKYRALAPGRILVGLSWRSLRERSGVHKSLTLLDLASVLQTSGVAFVNLQYGDCGADLAAVKAELGIDIIQDDTVDPLRDMDAAFAQAAAMDLVISTSNTTVHTAGALNIPVWVLLPYAKGCLWYWFLKRADSPWYPSARLIREPKVDPARPWWSELVPRVAAHLRTWHVADENPESR